MEAQLMSRVHRQQQGDNTLYFQLFVGILYYIILSKYRHGKEYRILLLITKQSWIEGCLLFES